MTQYANDGITVSVQSLFIQQDKRVETLRPVLN